MKHHKLQLHELHIRRREKADLNTLFKITDGTYLKTAFYIVKLLKCIEILVFNNSCK